jgi:hypothetical protein
VKLATSICLIYQFRKPGVVLTPTLWPVSLSVKQYEIFAVKGIRICVSVNPPLPHSEAGYVE